jgi:hypothetical protein
MVCEKCKGGHHEAQIILCDRCDSGWHMFCLSPPLERVPQGDWFCPTCVASGERSCADAKADANAFQALTAQHARQLPADDAAPPLRRRLNPAPPRPAACSAEFDPLSFRATDTLTLDDFERGACEFEAGWYGGADAAREVRPPPPVRLLLLSLALLVLPTAPACRLAQAHAAAPSRQAKSMPNPQCPTHTLCRRARSAARLTFGA